ncbi:MAG: hypothetical protein M3P83_00705 [Actinomycetota bacterium]|nr:hypothetical protein [Actinomycetota bacterium]
MPTLDLADVSDFFSGPGAALSAAAGTRWTEIDTRVREAAALPQPDQRCLKVVGLLNLLADGTGLRASADITSYALSAADQTDASWRDRLHDLETRGWLTYRGFADEYRLWQGSDVDLRGRVADAREQLRSTSPAELLRTLHSTGPFIAGKHTQRVGMLRYFTASYADATTRILQPLASPDPADGALVYYLDDPAGAARLQLVSDGRPVLLATSPATSAIRDAAVEAAAALAVLDQEDVAADRVARRELQDRVAEARRRLSSVLEQTFQPAAATYRLLTSEGLGEPLSVSRSLSRLLSDVCDNAYAHSPEIRNEMLGRRELTSQGAKARRELLTAMVERADQERLGLQGYGPERAMYEAILHDTGLHAAGPDGWGFRAPNPGPLRPTYGVLRTALGAARHRPLGVDELYRKLHSPPIGLKDGPIPVLLAVLLLENTDDVAIYQDGTYQPLLTADLLERLVKTPERFAIKSFDLVGARASVLTAISTAVADLARGPTRRRGMRNSTVLAVAAPLLALLRDLPDYTKFTGQLSASAAAVRDVLLRAREPDELLFTDLPQALDVAPFPADGTRGRGADVQAYAQRLAEAVQELQNAYDTLLDEVQVGLADRLGLPRHPGALRSDLRGRARPLDGKVLDRRVKSFLFTALDEELDDQAWTEALAAALGERAPRDWREEDRQRFHHNLQAVTGTFRRLQALHFDAAAHGTGDGFTARRYAITNPDGTETTQVLYVDDSKRRDLSLIVAKMLELLDREAGPEQRQAAWVLYGEQVLPGAAAPSGSRTVAPSCETATRKEAPGA